jgi:hypothetical protein
MAFTLGAGLTGLMQGFDQQQQQALRAQALRQALQQFQQQQQAKSLVGSALLGGPIPGLGGQQMPIGGMGGAPMPGVVAPTSPAGMPAGGGLLRPSGLPAPGSPAPERPVMGGGVPGVGAGAGMGTATAPIMPFTPAAPAAAAAAPAQQVQEDAGSEPMAAQPADTTQGGLGSQGGGGGLGDIAGLMRRIDPQAIAQAIHKARPDASPEAVAMATEEMYKMAESDKSAQQNAMLLMRALGIQHQDMRFTAGQEGQDRRLGVREAGADRRLTTRETAIDARQEQRLARLAQSTNPQLKASVTALRAQRTQLKDQITALASQAGSEDALTKANAELQKIDQQIADLYNAERKRVGLPAETDQPSK